LGGVILRHAVARHRGPDGGDVHDAAATRPAHLRDGRLRAERVALEVHAEDRVPALLARVDDRLVEPHAGVVDQHVEPTELLAGAPDEADGLGLAFGVRLDEDGPDALAPDLVRDAAPPVHVEIGDGDLRALLGEEPGRCLADARGPARDRRHLSAKPSHRMCSPDGDYTRSPRRRRLDRLPGRARAGRISAVSLSQLPMALAGWLASRHMGRVVVRWAISVVHLILGCLMDELAILLLTVPIFFRV